MHNNSGLRRLSVTRSFMPFAGHQICDLHQNKNIVNVSVHVWRCVQALPTQCACEVVQTERFRKPEQGNGAKYEKRNREQNISDGQVTVQTNLLLLT